MQEKGSAKFVTLIIILILIAGGIYFLSGTNKEETQESETKLEPTSEEKATTEEASDNTGLAPQQGLTGSSDAFLNNAGNVQVYRSPEITDLTAEQTGAELVILYFYADWCPLCKEEFPKLISAMDELKDLPVLAFRVNYRDSDTSAEDKAVAKEHGIAYQHTKVFLVDGERVLKNPETWSKDRYIEEITKILK